LCSARREGIKANELYYTLINVAASKPNAECTTNHNAKLYYYSFGNVAVFTTLEITKINKNWLHKENNRLYVGNACYHSLFTNVNIT
jgi:hypothetical protein